MAKNVLDKKLFAAVTLATGITASVKQFLQIKKQKQIFATAPYSDFYKLKSKNRYLQLA